MSSAYRRIALNSGKERGKYAFNWREHLCFVCLKNTPRRPPWNSSKAIPSKICEYKCVRTRKSMTENEVVGWHHQLDGHEFQQAPEAGDKQGSLACCSLWGHRVGHNWVTELNWIQIKWIIVLQFIKLAEGWVPVHWMGSFVSYFNALFSEVYFWSDLRWGNKKGQDVFLSQSLPVTYSVAFVFLRHLYELREVSGLI